MEMKQCRNNVPQCTVTMSNDRSTKTECKLFIDANCIWQQDWKGDASPTKYVAHIQWQPRTIPWWVDQLTRNKPDTEDLRYINRVSCFRNRFGSIITVCPHWGLLVPRAEVLSHQLPGTSGCYSSSKHICERSDKQQVLLLLDNSTAVTYVKNQGEQYHHRQPFFVKIVGYCVPIGTSC